MTKKRVGPLVLAVVAAFALAGGAIVGVGGPAAAVAQEATPTPTPVTTGNIPLLAISPALCFPLVLARFSDQTEGALHGSDCQKLDSSDPTLGGTSTVGHDSLMDLESIIGNGDGILQPSDFASVDLDGNQVHQSDDDGTGTSPYNGNLFILAFVPTKAPVRFRTNLGQIIPPGLNSPTQNLTTNPADTAGQVYVCDSQAGTASGPFVEDADCSGAATSTDGVVVARLRSHWGSTDADIGPGTVTVNQGTTDVGTIAFRVVGEPRTLSFITLETAIQDGAGGEGDCPLATDAGGFLGANGTAEKSIVLAVAKDIDGNAVTGAVINWSTDDPDKAIMAAPLTPTLDLGSFGFGAPNIICGNTATGTVTVHADIDQHLTDLITYFDPGASLATATTTFTVVGVPASMALSSDPANLPCDGTATATVSAAIEDADGTPALAGTKVHFDVQVLGTANPIDTTTNDKGIATSVISPLAGDVSGVPVTVSSGDVINSILVACSTTEPATPEAPGGTTAPGGEPSGGPGGVITGPNTGSGPGDSSGGWMYLLALSGLGLLAGSTLVWTGARAKRK